MKKTKKSNAPSPDEQLTLEATRASRIWQQVTANAPRQTAALDVAKLALELAQLRGTQEPASFLDEAARLLTEAQIASARERTRPEREQREQFDKLKSDFVDEFRKNQVPFDMLCRPARDDEKIGSSELPATESFSFTSGEDKEIAFEWRVYREERDFKKLIAKHAKRIYQEAGRKLALIAKCEPRSQKSKAAHTENISSWIEAAVSILTASYWLPDEWRAKLFAVKNQKDATALESEYVAAATQAFGEKLWQMAKNGQLDVVTLHSVYQTRQDTYKNRGPKKSK